ncbi:MAG: hypothetical protein CVU97_07200 [Firmicutes bacterium HGW-Firmicutes-21]|nr:MAG: hypothetical protein CVU97_07200 [Firmicutes bacterium HGW-Firmicutes-21]
MLADAITTYEINLTSDRYIKINSSENLFCYDYVKNSYSDILKKLCRKAVYPEDRKLFMSIYSSQNLIKAYENGRLYLYNEYRHLDKNGQAFWISCTTNLLSDPETGDIKAFSYIKDIDSQKRKELAIKHNSERDPLTDLYNRKAAQNLITDNLNNSVETSSTNAYIH